MVERYIYIYIYNSYVQTSFLLNSRVTSFLKNLSLLSRDILSIDSSFRGGIDSLTPGIGNNTSSLPPSFPPSLATTIYRQFIFLSLVRLLYLSSNERITGSSNTLPYVSDNRLRACTSPSLLSLFLSLSPLPPSTLFSETSFSLSVSLSTENWDTFTVVRNSQLDRPYFIRLAKKVEPSGSSVSSHSGHHFEFHRCSTGDTIVVASRARAHLARLLFQRERER